MLQPRVVFRFVLAFLAAVRVFFRSRHDSALEVLALRQQVAVLKQKRPRPRLNPWDRLFWTMLHQVWSRWAEVLVVVKPETVALPTERQRPTRSFGQTASDPCIR